jgi:hypothetical protein
MCDVDDTSLHILHIFFIIVYFYKSMRKFDSSLSFSHILHVFFIIVYFYKSMGKFDSSLSFSHIPLTVILTYSTRCHSHTELGKSALFQVTSQDTSTKAFIKSVKSSQVRVIKIFFSSQSSQVRMKEIISKRIRTKKSFSQYISM